VRGAVVPANVCLDLDDPPDTAPRRVVADEADPDQAVRGLEGRLRENGSIEDAQLNV
jgi:hypothetical protein